MKIIIDGRMADWSGIGRYTLNLLRNLAVIDQENNYIVLILPKDKALFESLPANFRLEPVNIQPYGLSEQLKLPGVLRRLKPDLVHFPHFTAPLLYRGQRVVTVHDLIMIDYKTNRGNGLGRIKFEFKHVVMRYVMRQAILHSEAVITDTAYVKQEIIDRYPASNLAAKIHPIHLAAEAPAVKPGSISRFNLGDQPFLLYVGNYYPNKNISGLVSAFQSIHQTRPELKLVLVGRSDYFLDQIVIKIKQLGLTDNVIITGRVSDEELSGLYKTASLFVFPSFSEGFGLPPLEAMAQGTPVISSSLTCLPEILGEAAAYFDPHNPAEMPEKINALLADPHELERLRKAGLEQVKQFSWRRMAEQTLEVYGEAIGNRQ